MIFCGNLNEKSEESSVSSLFDVQSDVLISSTLMPRFLLSPFAEALSRRCSEINWEELLRAEIEERLI